MFIALRMVFSHSLWQPFCSDRHIPVHHTSYLHAYMLATPTSYISSPAVVNFFLHLLLLRFPCSSLFSPSVDFAQLSLRFCLCDIDRKWIEGSRYWSDVPLHTGDGTTAREAEKMKKKHKQQSI